MTHCEIMDEIIRLKKEKNVCILAHTYQKADVCSIADFVGDSFGLSMRAKETDCDTVLMCGVRFMAESVKILSPEKKVLLSHPQAGCPMAEQMDKEIIAEMKKSFPDYTTVAYINTTAELKTICDVCVTSSSAKRIIEKIENDKILFIPDCNLASWVAKSLPEKTFKTVHGGCPTHLRISLRDVERVKERYPLAKILVHPECHPSVVERADFVGSTTEIMDFAKDGTDAQYIIGTENSVREHLAIMCPNKTFIPLSKDCVCHNMQLTGLGDVYRALIGEGGEEILIPEDVRLLAKKPIDEMIRLGKTD